VKAIVLCAGYGTRLGDLTREVPKPMLLLQGKPLLAYTLHYLASQGFKKIAINLHFLPEQITNYFGDGSQFGVSIHYSYEPQLLGTAGAVKNLETWLADVEDFLVLYGDILLDQDLSVVVEHHQQARALATLLLHQRPGSNSLVQMDEAGCIIGFVERPTEEQRAANPFPWVNSGVHMLNTRVLDYVPAGQAADFPRDVFTKIVGKERLYGVPLTGCRCAIDSPSRYAEANNAIVQGRYRVPLGLQ
jgi:mannose-1-phosphate guanylyltransferase/phosphomannomutase